MPRIYRNPPVLEAVCEIRSASDQQWDWTIPGLIYDKIKGDFPKKRQQSLMEVQVGTTEEMLLTHGIKPAIGRMQFLNDQESLLVQVGPNIFSINHLKPYTAWANFRSVINDKLHIYVDVAKPQRLERIGLRYVNRIEMSADQVELDDYFTIMPRVPPLLPQVFESFMQQVVVHYEDPPSSLRIILGQAESKSPESIAVILDLDFFTTAAQRVDLDEVLSWLDYAHAEIEKTFDACFTERTHKEIFQEEQA